MNIKINEKLTVDKNNCEKNLDSLLNLINEKLEVLETETDGSKTGDGQISCVSLIDHISFKGNIMTLHFDKFVPKNEISKLDNIELVDTMYGVGTWVKDKQKVSLLKFLEITNDLSKAACVYYVKYNE